MKTKGRHRLAILLGGIIFFICASIGTGSFAQRLEGFVIEGESLGGIMIGKSAMDDVIAVYGDDYKLVKHKEYSYEVIYKNLGLSFYSCQADPNKEIFLIEMQSPSKVTTSKGIKLGESTFADISEIYSSSRNNDELEFKGISFYAEEENKEEDSEPEMEQTLPVVYEGAVIERTNCGPGQRSDQANIVLDGVDISDNFNDVEDRPENEADQSNKNQADNIKESKSRIVKRIELVEKDGLRQCESKFPKK